MKNYIIFIIIFIATSAQAQRIVSSNASEGKLSITNESAADTTYYVYEIYNYSTGGKDTTIAVLADSSSGSNITINTSLLDNGYYVIAVIIVADESRSARYWSHKLGNGFILQRGITRKTKPMPTVEK